jgi:hypothetical protein
MEISGLLTEAWFALLDYANRHDIKLKTTQTLFWQTL